MNPPIKICGTTFNPHFHLLYLYLQRRIMRVCTSASLVQLCSYVLLVAFRLVICHILSFSYLLVEEFLLWEFFFTKVSISYPYPLSHICPLLSLLMKSTRDG